MDELVICPLELTMHGMAFGVRRRDGKMHIALFARAEDARAFVDAVNKDRASFADSVRWNRANYPYYEGAQDE